MDRRHCNAVRSSLKTPKNTPILSMLLLMTEAATTNDPTQLLAISMKQDVWNSLVRAIIATVVELAIMPAMPTEM